LLRKGYLEHPAARYFPQLSCVKSVSQALDKKMNMEEEPGMAMSPFSDGV